MRTDVDAASILSDAESKKLEFLHCEDAGHFTLFRVHFQFQLPFQIPPAGFHQPLRRSFALGKHHDVVCIPHRLYPSPVHLPIKFVEVDVRQQW